jgi:hypothetical protein
LVTSRCHSFSGTSRNVCAFDRARGACSFDGGDHVGCSVAAVRGARPRSRSSVLLRRIW